MLTEKYGTIGGPLIGWRARPRSTFLLGDVWRQDVHCVHMTYYISDVAKGTCEGTRDVIG